MGVGIWVRPERGTRPLLQRQIERSMCVCAWSHAATLHRRSTAAGSPAPAIALHGVELADAPDIDLARLKTQIVRAIRGPARLRRAKEIVYCLLSPGYNTLPVMRMKYDKLVGQSGANPGVNTGALASHLGVPEVPRRALRAVWALGRVTQGLCMGHRAWQWAVSGQHEALDMVTEDWALLRHRI